MDTEYKETRKEDTQKMGKNPLRKDKKGQLNDMVFVLVYIAGTIITLLIATFIYFELQDPLNNSDMATNESIQAYNAFEPAFAMADGAVLFIIVVLIIGLIVSSLFIPSSPVFIVVNIVGFLILVFLGAVFENLHHEVMEQGNMSQIAEDNLPYSTYAMDNLPYIGAVMVFIMTAIMYAKRRSEYG